MGRAMGCLGVVLVACAAAVPPGEPAAPLRPLASLPFFAGGRHRELLAAAERWRRQHARRPPFRWNRPQPSTPIRVYAKPPRWLAPAYRVNATCDVACDYASSLDDADVALSSLQPVVRADHRVATALLSFEPYAYCARGECLSLSYHRSADATYEFLPRSAIDWAARPAPPRPETPSSVVFVSKCNYKWRMKYLLDLAAAGVDVGFAGACNRTLCARRCRRRRQDGTRRRAISLRTFENSKWRCAPVKESARTTRICARQGARKTKLLAKVRPQVQARARVRRLQDGPRGPPPLRARLRELAPRRLRYREVGPRVARGRRARRVFFFFLRLPTAAFVGVVVYAGSPLIHEKAATWPPFVNVLDFESPAALAAHLGAILANDTLWAHYTRRDLPPAAPEPPRYDSRSLDDFVCDACRAARRAADAAPV